MDRLKNKIAIVTGATGGIGLASAKLFAAEGAKVVLVDLDQSKLDQAVKDIGEDCASAVVADVSQAEQVENYVQQAMDTYGRIDVCFCNAGIEGAIAPITDYPIDMFDKVMSVNVRGVWLGLKYVIPEMAKSGGSIILTSSLGGLRGMPRLSAYIAAKHAVVGIMRCAALECVSKGIRVNTINPAPIATRMVEAIEEGYAPGAANLAREKFAKAIPMRRYGQPEEVAQLALYLASDESSFTTGTTFPIDGGMSAS